MKQVVKCEGVRNADTSWPEPCGYVIGFVKEGEAFTGPRLCSECKAAADAGPRQAVARTPTEMIAGMSPEDIAVLKALLKDSDDEDAPAPAPTATLDRKTGQFAQKKEAA